MKDFCRCPLIFTCRVKFTERNLPQTYSSNFYQRQVMT